MAPMVAGGMERIENHLHCADGVGRCRVMLGHFIKQLIELFVNPA